MTVYESFKNIPDFPGYMISSFGRVYNLRRNSWLSHSPTEHGELTVGLMRNSVQCRRSVKKLVARSFVEGETELFNTPIQLDNDKTNLHASNIQWRPRWFAWKYARQFVKAFPSWAYSGPVVNTETGDVFETILDAAIMTGSLVLDIRWSLLNKTKVFPHGGVYSYNY